MAKTTSGPSKLQASRGEHLEVEFTKDYQKPMNQGGRIIRKGTRFYMGVAQAEKFIKTLKVAKLITPLKVKPKAPPVEEVAPPEETEE